MIRDYIHEAMKQAHYEILQQEGDPFYAEIPSLRGVLAAGPSLEECRSNLEDALDSWLAVGLKLGHSIPSVGGIDLNRLGIDPGWESPAPSRTAT